MLSHFYPFAWIFMTLALWKGWIGKLSQHEKLVYSAMLLSGIVLALWVDTLIKCGFRSIRTVPMMIRVFGRARRGGTLMGIVVLSLLFWLSPFATDPSPYRFHMSASLVISVLLLWLQPPFALALGESNRFTGHVLKTVSLKVFPFRVVALLDPKGTGYYLGSFSALTDNLRTASDRDWEMVVEQLADVVQLIILDARTDSSLVRQEVGRLKDRPDLLSRTLFIVGPNGEAPALHAHALTRQSPGINTAREEEMSKAEPLASIMRHPLSVPVTERRKRAHQNLARSIPFVALGTILIWLGLKIVDGEASHIFAWFFVMFCGYNTLIAAIALLVQTLDIIAYFLVTDEQWLEALEKDPLSANLRWKTIGLIPAALYAALWAAPGLWIFAMLRPL